MDVVGLVVEKEWRGAGGTERGLRGMNVDEKVEHSFAPGRGRGSGEFLGPGIRLLAPAILILVVESDRLDLFQHLRIAEYRGGPHALGAIAIHQRPTLLGRAAGAAQLDGSAAAGDVPTVRACDVSVLAVRQLDLDYIAVDADRAHRSRRGSGRGDRDESGGSRLPPDEVEGRGTRARKARRCGAQQLTFEHQMQRELHAGTGAGAEHDRAGGGWREARHVGDEVVLHRRGRPLSRRLHVDCPRRMPGQLHQVRLLTSELQDVEQIFGTRHQRPGEWRRIPLEPRPTLLPHRTRGSARSRRAATCRRSAGRCGPG